MSSMSGKITRLEWFLPAIDPVDGKIRRVAVMEEKIDSTIAFGAGAAIEMRQHMPLILLRPRAVWENPDNDYLMYVGQPEVIFDHTGEAINYFHGKSSDAFLVFVDGQKIVRDWTWGTCATPWHPTGWIKEFNRKVL